MDEDERSDLISRFFAVMTADFEDAAGMSANGQGRGMTAEERLDLAGRVHSIAQWTAVIADAIVVILEKHPDERE